MDPDEKSSFEKAFPSGRKRRRSTTKPDVGLFCQDVEPDCDSTADVRVEAVRADLQTRASLTKCKKLSHSKLDEYMNKACGELASATVDGIKSAF